MHRPDAHDDGYRGHYIMWVSGDLEHPMQGAVNNDRHLPAGFRRGGPGSQQRRPPGMGPEK